METAGFSIPGPEQHGKTLSMSFKQLTTKEGPTSIPKAVTLMTYTSPRLQFLEFPSVLLLHCHIGCKATGAQVVGA